MQRSVDIPKTVRSPLDYIKHLFCCFYIGQLKTRQNFETEKECKETDERAPLLPNCQQTIVNSIGNANEKENLRPFQLVFECNRQCIPKEVCIIRVAIQPRFNFAQECNLSPRVIALLSTNANPFSNRIHFEETISWVIHRIKLCPDELDPETKRWCAVFTFLDRNNDVWLKKTIDNCFAMPNKRFVKISLDLDCQECAMVEGDE